eukprot:scaffold11693_cov115-Isochrysis_galbana.AAC.15
MHGHSFSRFPLPPHLDSCGTMNRLARVNLSSSTRLARKRRRLGFVSEAVTSLAVRSAAKADAAGSRAEASGCSCKSSWTMDCQQPGAAAMRAINALAAGGSSSSGWSLSPSTASATCRSMPSTSTVAPGGVMPPLPPFSTRGTASCQVIVLDGAGEVAADVHEQLVRQREHAAGMHREHRVEHPEIARGERGRRAASPPQPHRATWPPRLRRPCRTHPGHESPPCLQGRPQGRVRRRACTARRARVAGPTGLARGASLQPRRRAPVGGRARWRRRPLRPPRTLAPGARPWIGTARASTQPRRHERRAARASGWRARFRGGGTDSALPAGSVQSERRRGRRSAGRPRGRVPGAPRTRRARARRWPDAPRRPAGHSAGTTRRTRRRTRAADRTADQRRRTAAQSRARPAPAPRAAWRWRPAAAPPWASARAGPRSSSGRAGERRRCGGRRRPAPRTLPAPAPPPPSTEA